MERRLLASLRFRLLAPVLVAVVPTVAIFLALARDERRLLVDEASGATTRVAQLVAERNQRALDTARGLLLAISRLRTVETRQGAACGASLAPLLEREPTFINMGAVDPAGVVFCSAASLPGKVDVSDRGFFREALRTDGLGVGEYVVSRVAGAGALGLGYPVRGEGGELRAVAYVSLATVGLQRELDALELPEDAQVAVIDRLGVTLAARPDGPRWSGRPFDPALVSAVRRADGPVAVVGTDGVERLYDLRAVTAPDGTVAMNVVAGIRLGAVLDPVNRLVLRAVAWSLVAIAAALAFAFAAAEVLLVRRLRRVAEASRRIAAGDLSTRTGVGSRDEIGELAAGFDDMAAALERLDGEKRAREEQLRQAQKMEAVGQLAGGVAHDFNNLLTVVLSAASALRERLGADDGSQQDVREILDAGERAATLTRQLLAFSRRQHLAPRLVDLGETAAGLERMLRRVLGENVALTVRVDGPALVHADPGQLQIALINLAVNARDAMPRGGKLDVAVRSLLPGDPARPAGDDVPAGPLALLSVRDSGVGIDAATRARMFEPFFTTKVAGKGTGLGLSIVLGVVGECGGALRVDSEPGRGTEFRLYFPIRAGEAGEVATPRDLGEPLRGTESVLVVEDDPHLRAVVSRALAERGYTVQGVETAADALAMGGPAPDLVLSDVILPDGNGLDLGRDLAARWRTTAFLFMSGYTGQYLEAIGARPAGAHLLPKPFTVDTLLRNVREALARRRSAA